MPARIEFIPYGERWEPKEHTLYTGQRSMYFRTPNYSRPQFVTGITIWAAYDNTTIVEHTLPGEKRPVRATLWAGNPPLIIHRVETAEHQVKESGTMRIYHIDSESEGDEIGDREPRRSPDLGPDQLARMVVVAADLEDALRGRLK